VCSLAAASTASRRRDVAAAWHRVDGVAATASTEELKYIHI